MIKSSVTKIAVRKNRATADETARVAVDNNPISNARITIKVGKTGGNRVIVATGPMVLSSLAIREAAGLTRAADVPEIKEEINQARNKSIALNWKFVQ